MRETKRFRPDKGRQRRINKSTSFEVEMFVKEVVSNAFDFVPNEGPDKEFMIGQFIPKAHTGYK